ncbi:hypothetical protein DH2020_017414 [Rehmannia glutinosa]|uniref:Terpene synthase metal-binding domain-containing protein n=1 Tax=Rehmannia glutinosa TaxID=99300 RepID=A0ABR0WRX2_REHGL
MFKNCLNWIIENQREGGFWGETNEEDLPTIDTLPATLACLLALKKWNVAHQNIERGLGFIHSKTEIILKRNYQNLPRWFILAFPAMIELAEAAGLDLVFPPGSRDVIANIFIKRQHILEMEELVEKSGYFPPLLSYLETLPSTYLHFDRRPEIVEQYLSCDGSLFQSPSATAQAFMITGNLDCMKYLQSLVQNFPNGVPAKYPMDGDLIRLCMVDHVQGLGLAEHFNEDIQQILAQVYSVYRATDLLFPGEIEMEEARKFALKMLEYINSINRDHNFLISKGLQNMLKYELNVPWTSRLDHLYHRKWIEENKISPLWIGKASFYRLSCLDNKKLMQLALLSPFDSIMRLVIAKAAIIVTVADDFYDMEGSLSELQILTDAVKRWDSRGLQGHSKTIFDALDDFVNDIAAKCHPQQGSKWRETFTAWMVERIWSQTGYLPSMDEYLATGMTSIAAHTIALPATSFLSQSSTNGTFKPDSEYHNITKLLMAITRLVNDTQSYQKEQEDGKMNLVLLHLNENPNITIEDAIAYVKQILEMKRKEFVKHVFMDDDMSKSCKQIHLSCMKVFEMFFNSDNLFDSETALVDDIQKAIYLPIVHKSKSELFLKPIIPSTPPMKKKNKHETTNISTRFCPILKYSGSTRFIKGRFVNNLPAAGRGKMIFPMKFGLCFI